MRAVVLRYRIDRSSSVGLECDSELLCIDRILINRSFAVGIIFPLVDRICIPKIKYASCGCLRRECSKIWNHGEHHYNREYKADISFQHTGIPPKKEYL